MVNQSRYICLIFWLGVALLQSSFFAFYQEATNLLCVTLETMEARSMLKNGSLSSLLLESRGQLDEIASQLDQLLGISFDFSFSFSLASIIFKGVRLANLRDSAETVLRTLLRIALRSWEQGRKSDPYDSICPDILGYFIALLPLSTSPSSYQRLLEDCKAHSSYLLEFDEAVVTTPRIPLTFLGVDDGTTALLVASFVGTILLSAQGDDVETEILLTLLSDLAFAYPDIMTMTYDCLQDRIKDAFANSSNPAIIRAASNIFRVISQDPMRHGTPRGSTSTLGTVDELSVPGPSRVHLLALEEIGMQGLASSLQFLPLNRGHGTAMITWIPALVGRIIE